MSRGLALMPKIIQNVREQLLAEAKKQIAEFGYEKTTIRSVASACGLGIGTVYNYFPSKDTLIASFLLVDWKNALANMQKNVSSNLQSTLKVVYDEIKAFIKRNEVLFSDKDASKSYSLSFPERHSLLRSQIAEIIKPTCETANATDKEFLALFVAESLLVWTIAGKDFEDIFQIAQLLFK